jgi:hypothetical protein
MNPNTTIRPWLLACGKQFGIRYAHEYRWPDMDNKPREKYVTYRISASTPEQEGHNYLTTASGNNAVEKASQSWITEVVIDLYNSQNGLYEISSMCVALQNHPSITALFQEHAALLDRRATDETEFDDEEINYHHRLVCTFRENIQHTLTETNGVWDTLEIQLDDGTYYDQYDVDDTGYTPTTP